MNKEPEYICDDRIYDEGGLVEQIRSMTDEEFEQHIKQLKELEAKEQK